MKKQIEYIRNKCVEANPSICVNENAQLIKFDHSVEYFKQYRPLQLSDILLAIEKIDDEKCIHIDWRDNWTAKNHIRITLALGHPIINKECDYDLSKPFTEQSEEVIEFIYKLLKE